MMGTPSNVLKQRIIHRYCVMGVGLEHFPREGIAGNSHEKARHARLSIEQESPITIGGKNGSQNRYQNPR